MKNYTFYQDEKIMIWQRTYFIIKAESEADAKAIVEKNTGNDIDQITDVCMGNTEMQYDTSEQLSMENNGGFATLEIYYDKEKEPFYNNGLDIEDK